jgi:hypothetical protein
MNDSRAVLASEIADSLRQELRAKQSAAQLSATIERAWRGGPPAELKLAYLRVAAAGASPFSFSADSF